jgi:hypothetical protein
MASRQAWDAIDLGSRLLFREWLWPDSRDTDWVFTFAHGRVWITTGRAWLRVQQRVSQ